LLRDLFQLDLADLDFGLYRLLRLKRQEVEAFLTEQLPRRMDEAFESAAGEERGALEKEISELADRIRKEIAEDAILESGEVNKEYRDTKVKAARKLLENYEASRRQLQSVQATEARKAELFNHLYAFFSRYYEAGDFIPRRRYGARESYAVPYSGEETVFHWANKDQHYVKTAEAFRDYAFTLEGLGGPFRVRFALIEASLPPGNTKGDTRYFFPLPDQIDWENDSKTLRIPFYYRLPGEKEIEKLGKNSRLQEAILQGAYPKILHAVPDDALRAVLSATVEQKEDQEIPLLLKHLHRFTRRNTTDYFVHRDLEGFLKRELEFYVKDQVLHLGDLEGDLEAKRRTLRVIRQLAEEVIAFLAQIEDVQKRLFEKRKFVLRADYLVPIKKVPRDLWKQILGNKAQIEAWKSLFGIEPKKAKMNEQFLEEHPTLVVNTSHFGSVFTDRLLAAFDDVDGATDGLLIHAENYQALRLLERKHAGKVKCIYIDPPYNTGSDDFIYKDRYQHSTWLAMMEERLFLAREWLSEDGVLFNSIDGNELIHHKKAMEQCFGVGNHVGDLIWKNATDNNPTRIAIEHEYVTCFAKNTTALEPEWKSHYSYAKELLLKYYNALKDRGLPPDVIQREYQKFIKDNAETIGELERYKFVDADGPYTGSESVHNPHPDGYDYDIIHPITGKRMRKPANGYRFPEETMKREYIDKGRLIYGPDENRIVKIKLYLRDYLDSLRSVITLDGRLGAYTLSALFGKAENVFDNPKPVELLERLISFATTRTGGHVLDFVAGSGTTAHAAINLNSQIGGRLKFILVEMADYFDTVLLPRIQKVIYTPSGRTGSQKGSQHKRRSSGRRGWSRSCGWKATKTRYITSPARRPLSEKSREPWRTSRGWVRMPIGYHT
jgi:adenine-specific DNA-methyltransferase